MNWWYWTWVLYSATIAAILRGLYLFGRAPARIRRWYSAVQEAQAAAVAAARGRHHLWGMSMPPPEGFWRTTGLTNILYIAPDMGLAWKCMRSPRVGAWTETYFGFRKRDYDRTWSLRGWRRRHSH